MNCDSKKCISIITLIIAVIIFVQTNFLTIMILTLKFTEEKETLATKEQSENVEVSNLETNDLWKLTIPKINVSAEIKEGTDGETINNYIGHFEGTEYENGNIGLIAASSGYKENYFSNLKDLSEGDVIIYQKGDTKKEYKVNTNTIIEQTDWSYLSNTEDNRLTLITGILEEPKKRLCVQATEIN